MDRTEEYYSQYFDIKDTIEKERKAKYQKDVYKLEADLEEAWGSKDIDKIISINEIINEYRDRAEGKDKDDFIKNELIYWGAIYNGTQSAWNDGYNLSSDEVAYYLSQSTEWVNRELYEQLDYIRIIRPQIFFSLNFMFLARDQQYYSRKKYLYNVNSFKALISSKLKEVDSRVPLSIEREDLTDEEVERIFDAIEKLEQNAERENNVSREVVEEIFNKDIELLNISALKEKYLKYQLALNISRMQKKLYWGVKMKQVSKERKLREEAAIEEYRRLEMDRIKNTTTIHNQQIYRYLDGVNHIKYHLYFNDSKKPLVLYSLCKDWEKPKYSILKTVYKEGIEETILSMANIK